MAASSVIRVDYRGRVAVVTIDNDKKLNALNIPQYFELAQRLREVAAHDEVFITVLTGKGRYFSAGADVTASNDTPSGPSSREFWLRSFVANNLEVTHAFYSHPKVLVAALNGPAIGLSAALVGFADFVYCAPHAFLLTPFASLGLVAEGGASRALARRLGPARASDALLAARRIPAAELLACGFANKVLGGGGGDGDGAPGGGDAEFLGLVLAEVDERMGPHIVGESLLGIKRLIRAPEAEALDAQGVREVFAGLDRFMSGVPQAEFQKIASGAKRHKL